MKRTLLLLQLALAVLQHQSLFADAKHKNVARGSHVEKQSFGLPEARAIQNQRVLKPKNNNASSRDSPSEKDSGNDIKASKDSATSREGRQMQEEKQNINSLKNSHH